MVHAAIEPPNVRTESEATRGRTRMVQLFKGR